MTRLLTYNVHRCVGMDRVLDVGRIAGVIATHEPDIVCLQELDVGRARTGWVDQATTIAARLGMAVRFHPAMQVEAELYGDAVLSRLPLTPVRTATLPTVEGIPGLEPRGALWVRVRVDERDVNVLNTHLGLVPREQRRQATTLAGADWLAHGDCTGPTLLAGDFNATSITQPYRILTRRLDDAQRRLGLKPSVKTFPSSFPAIRIDHVFVSREIRVRAVGHDASPLSRMASDHLPLIVDFDLEA